MNSSRIEHLIVDRDGVLNEEAPDLGHILHAGDLRWLPGSLQGLAQLRKAGVRISVATNQSAVGRGRMTQADLDAVHARLQREAEEGGGAIDAIFVCPHAPEDACPCRKPGTALIAQAMDAAGIAAGRTLVVGDSRRDLEAAWRSGVRAALVRTGKGRVTEAEVASLSLPVYDDLQSLVANVLNADVPPQGITMSIQRVFAEHQSVIAEAARSLQPVLERIIDATGQCLRRGNKVLACGNGGSASDAQHLVAELIGRFRDERRALAALALTADTATLTAVGNDYGFERVFARQVEGLARPGDLLFAISTSGNSANVLRAADAARERGCAIIAMTGSGGGKLASLADFTLRAPSDVVARIQEVHALCIHLIAEAMDLACRVEAAAPAVAVAR